MGGYVGDSNNIARKIKAIYVGDSNNIARKIKTGYVGVNNVARLIFSGSEKYTWANFLDYCSKIKNSQIAGTTTYSRLGAEYVIDNQTAIENAVSGTISEYRNFLVTNNSTATSYSVDDFLAYAQQVANDTNAPSQFRTNCTAIVNKASLFRTKLAGYSNIVVVNMSTTGWLDIRCYNNTIPVSQYNNSSITFNGSQSGSQFRWTPRR